MQKPIHHSDLVLPNVSDILLASPEAVLKHGMVSTWVKAIESLKAWNGNVAVSSRIQASFIPQM